MNPTNACSFAITASIASICIALSLTGCLGGGSDEPEKPTGPLYQCLGVAGYEPGTMERLIADLAANPPECKDGEPVWGPVTGEYNAAAKVAPFPDSLRYRSFLFDNQCRLIREYTGTAPEPGFAIRTRLILDMKGVDGKSLPTGEYYVNTEFIHRDGSRDTTYSKYGYMKNPCEP